MLAYHWSMTLFACMVLVQDVMSAVSICFMVVFSIWTIHHIALEIEMPFGDDNYFLQTIDSILAFGLRESWRGSPLREFFELTSS